MGGESARRGCVAIAMLATVVGAAFFVGDDPASAAPGSPEMTCALSGSFLHLRIHDWGESNSYWITRHKNAIVAMERIELHRPTTVPCAGGNATVHNTDRIAVNEDQHPGSEEAPSSSTFEIDMSNGAFAPGATREADGTSEIETQLNLHRAQVWIAAPPGPNHLGFGVRHEHLGLNVDGGQDLEVEMGTPYLAEVFAGPGHDLVDGRTDSGNLSPRRPRLFLWGNGGGDRMIGGGRWDQLIGGHGSDNLIGTHGATQLAGGSGPDRLLAGPESTLLQGGDGKDQLNARNHHHDWISCGPGDDHARADDHEENMGGCEHAPRVHTRF